MRRGFLTPGGFVGEREGFGRGGFVGEREG